MAPEMAKVEKQSCSRLTSARFGVAITVPLGYSPPSPFTLDLRNLADILFPVLEINFKVSILTAFVSFYMIFSLRHEEGKISCEVYQWIFPRRTVTEDWHSIRAKHVINIEQPRSLRCVSVCARSVVAF